MLTDEERQARNRDYLRQFRQQYPEKVRQYQRRYWAQFTEEERRTKRHEYDHRYRARHREKVRQDGRRYRHKHYHKDIVRSRLLARVHAVVKKARKIGTLARKPCEDCGRTADIQAHHDDYSKPLGIRWLCRSCHYQHHIELRRANN